MKDIMNMTDTPLKEKLKQLDFDKAVLEKEIKTQINDNFLYKRCKGFTFFYMLGI